MQSMKPRTSTEGFEFHKNIPVRVYSEDVIQRDRIERARTFVRSAINMGRVPKPVIVELGCGTADISGSFYKEGLVIGIDASESALETAKQRFSSMVTLNEDITKAPANECDVLILCEVLEHLEDPFSLVKKHLPHADYAVISHPLNEALDSNIAAGEHQWSYNEEDFDNWFKLGGHTLIEKQIFQMGLYTMIIGVGKRNANP